MNLISPEVFGKACGSYFGKYGWKNAELDNLLEELNKASGQNLYNWKDDWIMKAGMNEVEALFVPNENSNNAKL